MKQVGTHSWEVTEPTPIEIGRPQVPPSSEALEAMRQSARGLGATELLWLWVSINGDPPHLGIACAPPETIPIIGPAIERVWSLFSPDNPVVDILRFGDPSLDDTLRKYGESLLVPDERA